MNTMTRNQVFCFLSITCIISAAIFVWMFNSAGDSIVAVLPMMYTPGVAAILTSLIFREGLSKFAWRAGRVRYWIYGLAAPLVVSLLSYGIVWSTEIADFTQQQVVLYKWARMIGFDLPAPFWAGFLAKLSVGTLVTTLFVFGEELGWTGYLTPRLRSYFSVPATSLLVGACWSLWHYPAIIGGFYGKGTPLWIALPGFTLVLIGASFFRTVLTDKSNSLWPSVILHASHNIVLMSMFYEMTIDHGNADYYVSEMGLLTGFVYVILGIVFWKFLSIKRPKPTAMN